MLKIVLTMGSIINNIIKVQKVEKYDTIFSAYMVNYLQSVIKRGFDNGENSIRLQKRFGFYQGT